MTDVAPLEGYYQMWFSSINDQGQAVGAAWDNWTSSDNDTYPFKTIIAVTEPGNHNRTLNKLINRYI